MNRRWATPAVDSQSPGVPAERREPVLLLDIDLAEPIPSVSLARPGCPGPYASARCLVRVHTYPVGIVTVGPASGELSAKDFAGEIWQALGPRIVEHLRADGLPDITILDPRGLPQASAPLCLRERDQFLTDAPMISVVVATRDRPGNIATLLGAIARLEYPRFELLVVDNAPTSPATKELVQNAGPKLAPVRYVCVANPGTSNARNHGLRLAQGDIVAFVDDDVVMDPHWLTEVARGFAVSPRVACVTGPILAAELSTQAQLWIEQFGGFSRGFTRRVYDLTEAQPPDPLFPYTAGRFGSGANMAFRKSALVAIGGFDPALGGGTPARGGEDLAAFFQVISAGYQLVYQPSAIVFHAHHRDYNALRRQMSGYGLGLTAYLTKCMLAEPRRLPGLLARIPVGARYAFSSTSQKNQHRRRDYPRELSRLELQGMLLGPTAYFRGRRMLRRRAQPSRSSSGTV